MSASKSSKTPKVLYCCIECGWSNPKRMDQCREYHEWGALEETQVSNSSGGGTDGALSAAGIMRPTAAVRPVGEVSAAEARARPIEVGEPDRVLDSGIVPGTVALLVGESGVDKSTLLLDVAAKIAAVARGYGDRPVLYVTDEESASQVRLHVGRIDALGPGLLPAAETELDTLLGHVEAASPSLLVVDSVQTTASAQVEGNAGGITQVWAVAGILIVITRERNIPVLLVGHATKDGGIAGPRVLEYPVDVVTQFEGDRYTRLRLLRVVKNRYGSIDEVGRFDLDECGIVGLADSSGLFLSAARSEVSGTCVTVTPEECRPMPVEIQALMVPTNTGSPRRTAPGVDHSRTATALAVLNARLRVDTSSANAYVSAVGGTCAAEPTTGPAVAISVVSTARNPPTPAGLVTFGKVGLTGEVWATVDIQRRPAEAPRLGFDQTIMLLASSTELRGVVGIQVLPVAHVGEAMGAALLYGRQDSTIAMSSIYSTGSRDSTGRRRQRRDRRRPREPNR